MSANSLPICAVGSAFHAFPTRSGGLAGICEPHGNLVCTDVSCWQMPENGVGTIWFTNNTAGGSATTSPSTRPVNLIDTRSQFATDGQTHGTSITQFEPVIAHNVAEYVTVANDEQSNLRNNATYFARDATGRQYPVVDNAFSGMHHGVEFTAQMQPPNLPLLPHHNLQITEQAMRRQAYYHQRHHPQMSTIFSDCGHTADHLKNKSRFSATGSGVCAVVRDTKMSLSSSPPSPSAGSAGGSLGSTFARHGFSSVSNRYQAAQPSVSTTAVGFCRNSGMRIQSKKQSDMSVSSTLSSYSASSLSSTPSFTGNSPRKRHAGGEDPLQSRTSANGWMAHNVSCHSSSGDVIAGVNSVRICDRSSSSSPTDNINGRQSPQQQPIKRSRNDHTDDDVIFVSMTPGPDKLNDAVEAERPSTAVATKRSRKARKRCQKKNTRLNSVVTPPSGRFAMPAANLPTEKCNVSEKQTNEPVANECIAASTKGYFLRSSVPSRLARPQAEQITDDAQAAVTTSRNERSSGLTTRYRTRRQQRQKENLAQEEMKSEQRRGKCNSPKDARPCHEPPQPPSAQPSQNPCETSPDNSRVLSSRAASVIRSVPSTPESAQRRSSAYFKKLYDIQGMIGVGGGGSVFAGTRKADNVQVAVKQVPKAKVRRWGKLDGRIVPIEFELLHRAAESGNKGVIGMLDWYERRTCYLLVMERPQPVIDLFDYLNQHGALPENVARNIFRQLVEAVIRCHASGVVHRDIKDENVLLNLHTSEAKLIDFGCGTFLKDEPYTEFAGTPEFYPPEWFVERSYSGRRVDAWSLGVLLYTMLEAEVPFHKEKDTVACELRYKRAQTTASEACRHLISTMLQRNPNKRLSLNDVLKHPWLSEGPTAGLCARTPSAHPPAPTEEELMNVRDLLDSSMNVNPATSPAPVDQALSSVNPATADKNLVAKNVFQPPALDGRRNPPYEGRAIGQCKAINSSVPVVGCGVQTSECAVRS